MLIYKLNRQSITSFFMYCFTFLFIFTPPALYPFGNLHFLTIVSLVFLLTIYRNAFLSIIKWPELLIFISLHFCIIIYSVTLDMFTSFTDSYYSKFNTAYLSVVTIIEVLPCAIFIVIFFLARKKKIINFCNLILLVGMSQVLFVLLALMIPAFRDWIMSNSGDQNLNDVYEMVNAFRMFGLARGYTFGMPLFQGLCIVIAYVLGTYHSSRYYFLIPFFLLSIAVNARIALISLFIAPAIIFVLQFKRRFFSQAYKLMVIFFIFFSLTQVTKYNAENSTKLNVWVWLYSGIDEVVSFKGGDAKGNLESLTDTMWFMPKGIELLFGTGENVFGGNYRSSDIGYVINLFYGGLIFSVLLYASYTFLIFKCIGTSPIEKSLKYILLTYLLIANLKGNVCTPNDLLYGIMVISLFILVYNKQINNQIVL